MKIKIGGKEFDVADEVGAHLNAQNARLDAAEASSKKSAEEAAVAKRDAEKATARADVAEAELTKEKKARLDEAEKAKAGMRARVALESQASEVLGEDVKLDGLTDVEIKRRVVEHLDEVDLKGKSDAYIEARYDLAIERLDEREDEPEEREDELDEVRKAAGRKPRREAREDEVDPLEKFKRETEQAYLTPLSETRK
jgi:hypothetical protein